MEKRGLSSSRRHGLEFGDKRGSEQEYHKLTMFRPFKHSVKTVWELLPLCYMSYIRRACVDCPRSHFVALRRMKRCVAKQGHNISTATFLLLGFLPLSAMPHLRQLRQKYVHLSHDVHGIIQEAFGKKRTTSSSRVAIDGSRDRCKQIKMPAAGFYKLGLRRSPKRDDTHKDQTLLQEDRNLDSI